MAKVCLTNCNYNLVKMLSKKAAAVWRYDQYIKDAKKEQSMDCIKVLQRIQKDEVRHIEDLKKLVEKQAKAGRFC